MIPYAGTRTTAGERDDVADHTDIGHRAVPGALFSMEAADNAEVVSDETVPGPASMWSTSANPDDAQEVAEQVRPAAGSQLPPPPPSWSAGPGTPGDGRPGDLPPGAGAAASGTAGGAWPSDDDQAWARMGSTTPPGAGPPGGGAAGGFGVGRPSSPDDLHRMTAPTAVGAPGAGGVFSAEPVERDEDVLDEGEVDGELEDDWVEPPRAAPVFSSGPQASMPRNGAGAAQPPPGPPPATPFTEPPPTRTGPFAAPGDPWTAWDPATASPAAEPPPFGAPGVAPADDDPTSAVAADQHGLDVAVSRLRPEDRERARVPLSVCGALLLPDEHVVGAVTGQMLGRPAAVVVTQSRVLVVNDRRWQPIVDVYPIDDALLVRGRHDRQVAALSFADDTRLSMVDGITEVELAVGLAEAIRDRGVSERGGGSAF